MIARQVRPSLLPEAVSVGHPNNNGNSPPLKDYSQMFSFFHHGESSSSEKSSMSSLAMSTMNSLMLRGEVLENYRKIPGLHVFCNREMERMFVEMTYGSPFLLVFIVVFLLGILVSVMSIYEISLWEDGKLLMKMSSLRIVAYASSVLALVAFGFAICFNVVFLFKALKRFKIIYEILFIAMMSLVIVAYSLLDVVGASISTCDYATVCLLILVSTRLRWFHFFALNCVLSMVIFFVKFFAVSSNAVFTSLAGFMIVNLSILNNYFYELRLRELFTKEVTLRKVTVLVKRESSKGSKLVRQIFPPLFIGFINDYVFSADMGNTTFAKFFPSVTLGHFDIVGWSKHSRRLSCLDLIEKINQCCQVIDQCLSKNGVERLALDGDGILFGKFGLDVQHNQIVVVLCADSMIDLLDEKTQSEMEGRVGVATGWIYAMAFGLNSINLSYFGHAVRRAKELESQSRTNCVNVCNETKKSLDGCTEVITEIQWEETDDSFLLRKLSVSACHGAEEEDDENELSNTGSESLCSGIASDILLQEIVKKSKNKKQNKFVRTMKNFLVPVFSLDAEVTKFHNYVFTTDSFVSFLLCPLMMSYVFFCDTTYVLLFGRYFSKLCHVPFVLISFLNFFVFVVLLIVKRRYSSRDQYQHSSGASHIPNSGKRMNLLKMIAVVLSYSNIACVFVSFVVLSTFLLPDKLSVFLTESEEQYMGIKLRYIQILVIVVLNISRIPNVFVMALTQFLCVIPWYFVAKNYDSMFLFRDICVISCVFVASGVSAQINFYKFGRMKTMLSDSISNLTENYRKNFILASSILPPEMASKMIKKENVSYRSEECCVCFFNIKNFEKNIPRLNEDKVRFVNQNDDAENGLRFFKEFFEEVDNIILNNYCLKIKAFAAGYIVISNHSQKSDVPSALRILQFIFDVKRLFDFHCMEKKCSKELNLSLSIGIHYGFASFGVVGTNNIKIDCYGDCINQAARLYQTGETNRVHVSDDFVKILKVSRSDSYEVEKEERTTFLKGIGNVQTFYVVEK